MNAVYFFSVVLKGVGAVLEVGLQVLITRTIGLAAYGDYTTWVNAADLLFWLLFSGLVKCNTFYLSEIGTSIRQFKTKYYLRYVLPLGVITLGATVIAGQWIYMAIAAVALAELLVMDQSSSLLARKRPIQSLFGEYILGRMAMLAGVAALWGLNYLRTELLLWLYLVQFAVIGLFFLCGKRDKDTEDKSYAVSLGKLLQYQRADVVQTAITQLPVLMQYFFTGAVEAGVVSLVLLVKKLVNFISGPTSKIFLPEFSRFYKEGKPEKIGENYASIMRIQMLFVAPLSVVLIGFPYVVLGVFNEELLPYAGLFSLCSAAFLIGASMGPGFGVMQMTGHERADNLFRECGLAIAVLIFIFFRTDKFAILYSLMAETLFESVGKYIFTCIYLKKMPVSPPRYLFWWLLPAALVITVRLMNWDKSIWIMLLAAGGVFAIYAAAELRAMRRKRA